VIVQVKNGRGYKKMGFLPTISHFILETIRNMAIVTKEVE